MTKEVRDTVLFQPAMPDLASMNAAERERWFALKIQGARARAMRHGMAILRERLRRRDGEAEAAAPGNAGTVSLGERRETRRDGDRDAA